MKLPIVMTVFALSTLTACSSDDGEDLPEVDCSGDVPAFSEVSAFSNCTMCHSSTLDGSERAGAPGSVNFDTFAGAEPHATKAAEEVFEGKMPPGGGLSAAEEEELYRWALCGAQE